MAEDRTRQEGAWKSRDIPIAWLKADGATDGQALDRLRELIESGHREQDNEERATRGHLSPAVARPHRRTSPRRRSPSTE